MTHKEATRFFMTIPEASQLVIQAAAKATTGEVMLLDMGEPVKIHDLATQFIQLSGFSTEDVAIDIIGLKEGEKLFEELLTSDEFVESRLTDKIFKARINTPISDTALEERLLDLSSLASKNSMQETKDSLRALLKDLQNIAKV